MSSLSPVVESRSEVLLRSLLRFYSSPHRLRVLTDVLSGKTKISLRTLDWLCTNYAKKHNTVYSRGGATVNLHLEYKSRLKAFSKVWFDPFQRRTRIELTDADGGRIETTTGQLNFFRFAISCGVVDYALAHASAIEADMLRAIQKRQASNKASGPRAKRTELSPSALKSATKTDIAVTLRFR